MPSKKSPSSAFDPQVKVSFAITMRAMALAAAAGYTEYIGGVVDAARALAMVRKFDDLFEINITPTQRSRNKDRGLARFQLFLYPRLDSTALDWFLFKAPGAHPNLGTQQWRSLKRQRLEWHGYELAELPYTAAERANWIERNKDMGTSSWTWCMSDDTVRGWKKRIRTALNHAKKSKWGNDQQFRQVLKSLSHVPGHRVCRRQVFELRCYINDQRHRLKVKRHEWSAPIPYLCARRCAAYPLSTSLARWARAESFFPPATRGTPSEVSLRPGYRSPEPTQQEQENVDPETPHDPNETDDRSVGGSRDTSGDDPKAGEGGRR